MPETTVPLKLDLDGGHDYVRLVCVLNEKGLHARPAAKLAQAAQRFDSVITIVMNGQEVDAKSILDILTLAAGHGANLELRAQGDDAGQALDALADLFKNRFQ
jgi:phosphocarrier protein